MSTKSYEGGIRPYRIEFVRESTEGTAPSNPSWNLYSDTVMTFEPALSPETAARDALGDPDTAESHAGMEQHEITVAYDLQQWLVDGSSSAQDAAYDGIARNSDNALPNTHTVVRRMDQSSIDASNTINGSTSYDTRQYFVGVGGSVDEVVLTGDPTDGGSVVQVELTYAFERGRLFQIDQPSSAVEIGLESTSSSDTSQSVTVEDEGASTTESKSLNGTTTVWTSATFGDIDALELDAETEGDVKVYLNAGTSSSPSKGDQISVLKGQSNYDQGEGDLGVPALGSGSHASAIGTEYELFIDGDTVTSGGSSLADEIAVFELSFANGVSSTGRSETSRPALAAEKREAEAAATVFGETERYQHTVDMLTNADNDIKWTLSDPAGDTGSITLSSMDTTEVGAAEEAQQGIVELDVTLANQTGVTIA